MFTTPRMVRILYVKSDIDEKESAEKLEEAVKRKVKKPVMVFTCVTSGLMAVECVKSVTFDVIILEEKLSDFTGAELLNTLFTSQHYTSPIFLVKRGEVELAKMRLSSLKYPVMVLPDPFSDFELCCAIRDSLMNRKLNVYFHQPKKACSLPAPVPETTIRERSVREELEDRANLRVHPSAPQFFPVMKRNRGESFDAYPPALNLSLCPSDTTGLEAPPPVNSATGVVSPTATQATATTDEEFSEFLNYLDEEGEVVFSVLNLSASNNNNDNNNQQA